MATSIDGKNIEATAIEQRDTQTVADVQMVFQNPFDTLNPSMTVGRQIIRALEIFKYGKSDVERAQRMLELLDLVKLPRAFAERMPRQLFAGKNNVLVSPVPLRAGRALWSQTNLFPPWTYRCRLP